MKQITPYEMTQHMSTGHKGFDKLRLFMQLEQLIPKRRFGIIYGMNETSEKVANHTLNISTCAGKFLKRFVGWVER